MQVQASNSTTTLAQALHGLPAIHWLSVGVCRFELVAPPRFGLVCLRLRGADNEGNKELLAAVNSAGGQGEGGVNVNAPHDLGRHAVDIIVVWWQQDARAGLFSSMQFPKRSVRTIDNRLRPC